MALLDWMNCNVIRSKLDSTYPQGFGIRETWAQIRTLASIVCPRHAPPFLHQRGALSCLSGRLQGLTKLGARCLVGAQETGSAYTVVVGA